MIAELTRLREEREKAAQKALERIARRQVRLHRFRVVLALALILAAYMVGWQTGFLHGRYPDVPHHSHT